MQSYEELIAAGRDTDALRLTARRQYETKKIGHGKMQMMVRVADELDYAKQELNYSRAKRHKQSVRDFLEQIALNEIISGKAYDVRIDINDGGYNSYIGLCVHTEDYGRKKPVTRGVRIIRHTNSVEKLENTWEFELGGVCHAYADNENIPLCFESYGKSPDEAEAEAEKYYDKLVGLIRKKTSDYKIQEAESEEIERAKLLERLAELDKNGWQCLS